MSSLSTQIRTPGLYVTPFTPYKDTPLFLLTDGKMEFGLWEGDPDIIGVAQYDMYQIRASEVGRLDLIAWYVYNNPQYWWFIAYANAIIDPVRDMAAGDFIRVPKQTVIDNYLQRNSRL